MILLYWLSRLLANPSEPGQLRFFFYSNEGNELPHIHVQKAEKYAKFWLKPIQMAEAVDFTSKELRHVQNIIAEHSQTLLEAWYEHFTQ